MSASLFTTCNFCVRRGHISSTCPLRNGSQKNSNAKVKSFGWKNPRSLTLKDPKIYEYLNQLEFYVVGFKE